MGLTFQTLLTAARMEIVDFFMASTTPGQNTVWAPITTTVPNPVGVAPGVTPKEVSVATKLKLGLSLQAVRAVIRFAAGNLIGEPCPTGGGATHSDTDDH